MVGEDSQASLTFFTKKQPEFIDLLKGGEYNIGDFSLSSINHGSNFLQDLFQRKGCFNEYTREIGWGLLSGILLCLDAVLGCR
jgi:hypothetical protein